MFKRMGAFAAIPLVVAIAAMTLAAPVSAKPSAGVTITQTAPCTYLVWYYWGGMGHGNDLTATVSISGYENGNSSRIDYFQSFSVSGRDGILSHEFHVTGQSTAYQFKGNGELTIVSKSQVLDKSSKTTTNMVPFAPVTCS